MNKVIVIIIICILSNTYYYDICHDILLLLNRQLFFLILYYWCTYSKLSQLQYRVHKRREWTVHDFVCRPKVFVNNTL